MNNFFKRYGICVLALILSSSVLAQDAGEVRVLEESGMEFVWCPPGEALIGSPKSGKEVAKAFGGHESWYSGEHPQRTATIAQGFWMGRYEVTREQWKTVMATTPWTQAKGQGACETCPASGMNYRDCVAFVEKLRETTNLDFRLPTEEEWEYASRGGAITSFYFGEENTAISDHGWWRINAKGTLQPVGKKKPNDWGLFDVIGNVAEWTSTVHEAKMATNEEKQGAFRVVRGGNVESTAGALRHSWRMGQREVVPHRAMGLRLVLVE